MKIETMKFYEFDLLHGKPFSLAVVHFFLEYTYIILSWNLFANQKVYVVIVRISLQHSLMNIDDSFFL